MKSLVFTLLAFLVTWQTAQAEVSMPKFFSDNMVLQRERPIRIWGRAANGESVTVRFAGSEVSVQTDRTGRWEATLPAMAADATPREMTVTGRADTVRFTNVVVGDVWLCSGQSNMEWRLDPTTDCEAEIAASANPNIRLLSVGDKIAFEEQDDIDSGRWVECTPETSRVFSAVGYWFGKFIHTETGVPVGLIDSSWGGTDIETWTSWDAMRTTSDYARYAGKRSPREAIGKELKNHLAYSAALENDPGDRGRWYDPAVAAPAKHWRTMTLPQVWENVLGAADGHVWFRKSVTLPASAAGQKGVLHLPAVDDADVTYVNGLRVGATHGWDRPRRYELPAGALREAQNLTLELPATGQAVITDIGEANDIHPRNKRDVGYRLSRAALNVAYGRTDVAAGGPVYRSMERDGNRIVLTFDAADALKPSDGNRYGYLHGFSVAGADRRFVWAKAYIRDEKTVVVFSDEVAEPVAVRYGWADNPQDDDLTDASGLLASPFRTDDWPGITK